MSESQTASAGVLAGETDEDLLVIISMKDDDQATRAAFSEFHGRFKRFLHAMTFKVCRGMTNDPDLVHNVVANTFMAVWEKSQTFNARGVTDPMLVKRQIERWLSKIAKNEFLKQLRDGPDEGLSEESDAVEDIAQQQGDGTFQYNEAIVQAAIEYLPKERDRHIFRMYLQYQESGAGGQPKKLPPDVMKDLALRYDTTSENLRQISFRARKTVVAYLKAHYKPQRRK